MDKLIDDLTHQYLRGWMGIAHLALHDAQMTNPGDLPLMYDIGQGYTADELESALVRVRQNLESMT